MCLYAIITFRTTHFALKAKRVLERLGIRDFDLTAVPREFSAECGFCLKAPWDQRERMARLLQQNNVEYSGIHCLDRRQRQDGTTFV
jgi:hypothetical protein